MKSLCQGDLLEKTDDLAAVLKDVHPYFLRDDYKCFMVLSQSCDLVRRNGSQCKTPYITLAAVRDYQDFLEKTLVANHYAEKHNGFLLVEEKTKNKVSQLIERVYNNNENDYFFLYKENNLGLSKSLVVYLKVSIALKSRLHYDTCLHAKRLELSDEFKAKLGWLVGNMYSRVGTTDWDSKLTQQMKNKMIEDDVISNCIIGTKEQLKKLKQELNERGDIFSSHQEAMEFVSSIEIKSKYEQVMDLIELVINDTGKKIDPKDKEKLINAIKSRKKIQQLIG
jgi:hypothetical protein